MKIPHIDADKHIIPDHQRLVEKIVSKDELDARQGMKDHLVQIYKNYQKAFQNEG